MNKNHLVFHNKSAEIFENPMPRLEKRSILIIDSEAGSTFQNGAKFMEHSNQSTVDLTAEIVSAYVANNSLPASELPAVLNSVYAALGGLGNNAAPEEAKPEELKPAVPIKKSVTDDYLICLEDGKRFKSLKRHLMSAYNMTPQQYREKWSLPKDYPMVAAGYAQARSNLAKSLGLGRKLPTAAAALAADPAPKGRKAKAAA